MTDYKELIRAQRKFFGSGAPSGIRFRERYLRRMYAWIEANEGQIEGALKADLGKAPFEAYATEIGIVKEEIRFILKHLREWTKVKRVKSPLVQFPSCSFRYPEAYGVVLVMSPWNYPFQLSVAPLAAAVAAGNCVVLKASADSPHTSRVLQKMVKAVFHPEHVSALEGGRKENEALLEQRFDYIFFTGSVEVGKSVMKKAAAHLTPVSLELGGKSPCIVDETADIRLAAKRIVWGKFLNAGQTCVAPDYVFVQHSVRDKLVRQMEKMIRKLYGENPMLSPDYPHIINRKHFERILGLMKEGTIVCGGHCDEENLQIEPTILTDVTWDSPVMQEEIFGPVLPVMTFYDIEEAVEMVRARPKPLALYLFTESSGREREILRRISFGGGCINDTVVHLSSPHLPFGGVGNSGMGSYHGKAGFDTFTHWKSILKKSTKVDIPVRYAPYHGKLDMLKKLMK